MALLSCCAGVLAQESGERVWIDPDYRHLGDSTVSDWENVPPEPGGFSYEIVFQAKRNPDRSTLRIRHRDVGGQWSLQVNGTEVSILRTLGAEGDYYYELPADVLVDGKNKLAVVPRFEPSAAADDDDIALGRIELFNQSLRQLLKLQSLRISIYEAGTDKNSPARISITDDSGERPEIFYAQPGGVAVRSGLVYANGEARIELPQGKYRVVVTRGTEWSRGVQEIVLGREAVEAKFELVREVDTTGFVAADTHIHTLQFSGHGDASADERMITLAGEGIELAVATDHNHNIDYRPFQEKLELNEFFTPVVGNEVTSTNGHFNAFPLDPDDEVPLHDSSDWVQMVDDMRLKGAKVVILNHPNWPDANTGPFGVFNLNRATGDRQVGTRFTFDAMELVNSTVDTPDPLFLFHDWFALLNRGEKIFAVGVSDSHTVGDPVGQGRTYVRSDSDDPSNLNVDELCQNIAQGRTSVSLGIFTDVSFDEQFQPGDLIPVEQGKTSIALRVRSSSWVKPKKALVFVNGVKVAEQSVPVESGRPTDAELHFEVPITGIDAHLVCIILGEPVVDDSWKTLNDYTLAATNPVFLDVNRDGKYSSPRESAQRVLDSVGQDNNALMNTMEILPPFLAVQAAALVESRLSDAGKELLRSLLETRSQESDIIKRYLEYDSNPEAD